MHFHVYFLTFRISLPKAVSSLFHTLEYRINGGARKIEGGGGLEMVRYNNNRGVGIIGGGCLEKQKIVVFLGKHVSLIYLCEQ